jgi:hypothetical protein
VKSHIDVTDAAAAMREEYTTHALHCNSRGKMWLTHLSTENMCDCHVPGTSSGIVITHARASPLSP